MSKEITESDISGEEEGRRLNVAFIDISHSDQKRFDDLYITDGLKNAKELSRFGIDGEAVFRKARRIAENIEINSAVICGGN